MTHDEAVRVVRTFDIKRAWGVVSDTHCGSKFGIMPPVWKTSEGIEIKCSVAQHKMYEQWQYMKKVFNEWDVTDLLLVGDMIEGLNVKESGHGNLSQDIDEQSDIAVTLLDEITHRSNGRKRKIYSVSGTHYHRSKDSDTERAITKRLGGKHFGPYLTFQVIGSKKKFYVAHGGSNSAIYREMIAGREILFMKEASADQKLPKFDILLHGHGHSMLHLEKPGVHWVQNGCFKIFDGNDFSMKNFFKFQPDIGFTVIMLDTADRFHIIQYDIRPTITYQEVLQEY